MGSYQVLDGTSVDWTRTLRNVTNSDNRTIVHMPQLKFLTCAIQKVYCYSKRSRILY